MGYESMAQTDTADLLRNAKLRLIDRFQVGNMNEPQYQSYCRLRLKGSIVSTKGFKSIYFFRIPNQPLWVDTISNPSYRTVKNMPKSEMIDSPYTDSYIIAISANSGRTYAVAGFDHSDIEELIYMSTQRSRLTDRDLELIREAYNIQGFDFILQKGRLLLTPQSK
jgi:hypothetical protein